MADRVLRRISRRVTYQLTGPTGYTTRVRVMTRFTMGKYDGMILRIVGKPGQEGWVRDTQYAFAGPSLTAKRARVVDTYDERGKGPRMRMIVRDPSKANLLAAGQQERERGQEPGQPAPGAASPLTN